MQQLKTFWDGLDPRRRLIAGLSVLAILAAVFGITRVATTPDLSLLYSGLDASAAGEVVAELEAEGVPFEVNDTTILVDSAARDRIRMALAAKGLPAGGPAGYEILDNLSGFGTTSQMFDAAYWRAKEGELARTITGSPNVRSARVHLANPVSQPFSRTPAGSASVTVTLSRGELDRGQAEAIRYLVSSAVAGITPDAVAVIDAARGVVLAGKDDKLTGGGPSANERAETMRANIQRLLEARVGAGRAIVEVNVDADMDSQTISERTIDPESRVAISSETEESSENAQGTAPGVTVASNLPDGDVGGDQSDSTRNSSQTRERQNFEVSETRRERVILPGQVRRISVAVMVDGITATGADGKETWAPRPPEEMETLRQLVQSAIGFDTQRGDVVTIESLQFTPPAEQGALVERSGSPFLEMHGARLAQLGVLGAIVLALIFFVLRPMTSRRPMLQMAELTGPHDLAAGLRHGPAQIGHGDILDLPAQTVTKIERLRDVITTPNRRFRRRPAQLDRISRNPQGARRIMSAYRLETFSPASGPFRPRGEPRRAAPRSRARGGLPRRLPRRPGHGDRDLPRRPGPADQRADRGHRQLPRHQRGRPPPRRRQPRADDRGARRQRSPRSSPTPASAWRSPASSSAPCSTPRRRGRGCAAPPSSSTRSPPCSPSAASPRPWRRAPSSCRARRRSSGTRATTISISTPASRRSAPASRRICSGATWARTMTQGNMDDDAARAGRRGPRPHRPPGPRRRLPRRADRGHDLGRQGPPAGQRAGRAAPRLRPRPSNSTIDDPVELYIGDRLIARGELQEIGDDSGRLGVRLTEVADFSHEL